VTQQNSAKRREKERSEMKAAVFQGAKRPFSIEEIDTPEPKDNQVLVRVEACNICGGDLYRMSGGIVVEPIPSIIGHQVSGTIVAVGRGVVDYGQGDRVAVLAYEPCYGCANCLDGVESGCLEPTWSMVSGYYGGFQEYVAAPTGALIRVPDNIPLDEASSLADAFCTSFHAAKMAAIHAGDNVVIFGVGDLGSCAVQFTKLEGAYVVAVDTRQNKLEIAQKLGADELINVKKQDPVETVLEMFADEGGADVALEFAGTKETTLQCLDSVRSRGRVVLVGATDAPIDGFVTMPFATNGFAIGRELTLMACKAWGSRRNLRTVFKLRERNCINTSEGVEKVPLDDINRGFELKQNGLFNRVLIKP
jgi:D-arabinose 1-dehydrogenase-like Zn-dependent alcohol dehydrogenase